MAVTEASLAGSLLSVTRTMKWIDWPAGWTASSSISPESSWAPAGPAGPAARRAAAATRAASVSRKRLVMRLMLPRRTKCEQTSPRGPHAHHGEVVERPCGQARQVGADDRFVRLGQLGAHRYVPRLAPGVEQRPAQ